MRTLAAVLTALLSCGCTSTGPTADAGDPMTLDRLLSGPPLVGAAPSRPAWSPDSRHLAFRWRDHDDARSELWLVDATGDHRRRLTDARQGRGAVGAFAWLPDARGLVYLRSRTLWRVDLDGSSRQLASFDGGAADLQVSPDGRYASVLQRGDLWLVDLVSGATLQATEVAVPSISAVPVGRYRRRDVEIGSYVWGGPTYAWSPDGRTIAVHHVDRRAVRKVPFPYYLADETDPNFVRRGYPGDANERRTVGLLDVATRRLELLDLPEPEARRVVDFSWSRNGELLIDRDADTAVDRWLHVLDPGTGALRELWHDHRDTRVYTSAASAWHPDG
ncbi:MAG: DPP IV N-terminal domain-containing protein, partial [Planctomycetes bacterium]|nr:DPP IV N-terminal domain-containing protein [Planctomycetota bacterium]